MKKRDEILSANAVGNLLEAVTESSYDESDCFSTTLAELHNSGEIDFLCALGSDQLASVSGHSFFDLQQVFCQVLPQLDCTYAAASAACHVLYVKAAGDSTASRVFDALRKWAEQDKQRVQAGLAMVRNHRNIESGATYPLLLAAAAHDIDWAVEEAINLSGKANKYIRLDALAALGRMPFKCDDSIPNRVMQRLGDAIDAPQLDQEDSTAIESALNLLSQIGNNCVEQVEPLLLKACATPNHNTRREIAKGLQRKSKSYTDAMVNCSLDAIKYANSDEIVTIEAIDSILRVWDIDGDRKRILDFLSNLLTHSDESIELKALDRFLHGLAKKPGHLLGWYAISLLLTGDHILCRSADHLISYRNAPDGLDIDLTPFELNSQWVLYLAMKIIGYCLMHSTNASMLLLSCLRAVPENDRSELEVLILNHFLINYPGAIKRFEEFLNRRDPARKSVKCLSEALRNYLAGLRNPGPCDAFQLGSRERWLQFNHSVDQGREILKQAKRQSVLWKFMDESILLFGTRSISYICAGGEGAPQRQEISIASHKVSAELPRLLFMDPVGLNFAMRRFRNERPPS